MAGSDSISRKTDRYFCLVELPSALKKKMNPDLKEASLNIFHSDAIEVILAAREWRQRLQTVTQDKIARLLFQHFGEHLAIDKGVYAYHWIPHAIKLDVENSHGQWNKILVVLLERNSEKFGTSISSQWLERIKAQMVRDWATLKKGLEDHRLHNGQNLIWAGNEAGSVQSRSGQCEIGEQIANLRGRKLRRARRILIANQSLGNKVMTDLPEAQPEQEFSRITESLFIDNPKRGRTRRQLRRTLALKNLAGTGVKISSRNVGRDLGPSPEAKVQQIIRPPEGSQSFESGWDLQPQAHDLRLGDVMALNENPLCLSFGISSLSLQLPSKLRRTTNSMMSLTQSLITLRAPKISSNKPGVKPQNYLIVLNSETHAKENSSDSEGFTKSRWRTNSSGGEEASDDSSYTGQNVSSLPATNNERGYSSNDSLTGSRGSSINESDGELAVRNVDLTGSGATSQKYLSERSYEGDAETNADISEREDLAIMESIPIRCTGSGENLDGESTDHLDPLEREGKLDSHHSGIEDQFEGLGIVVAELEDHTGLIGRRAEDLFNYGYVQSVEARSSLPKMKGSLRRDSYWARLALLAMGSAGYRNLPYSQGYGVTHFNPMLVRREWRLGCLDVDMGVPSSNLPRWRAAWTFESASDAPCCECKLACISNIQHSIQSCRHLVQDAGAGHRGSWGRPPIRVLHEHSYFAHWPWEYFTHPGVEIAKELPKNPESFGILASGWESAQNPSHQDIDSIRPAFRLAKDETRNVIRTETDCSRPLISRRKDIELPFEYGLCHLMVLGTSKNIDLGLAWVLEGADRGCIKARALCRRLFHLYNKKFERSGEIQRQWLYEGSVNGSVIALEDLGHFYAESHEYRAAVREIKFSFNLEGAKALRYHEHILPRFDLSNSNILLELAKKAKIRSESGGLENDGAKQEANHDIKSMFLGNWGTYFDQLYYYGTLLHLACLFGFADSVEILLGAGLDIEESNSSPKLRTPLLCALRRGHHEIAKLLIERGADCRPFPARDPYVIFTPSPLHYLVYIEDEDAAVELAELIAIRGGDVNNMCKSSTLDTSDLWSLVGSYSTTPLRWAVMHGKAKLVRKLLSLGARFATSRLWKSGDTPTSKITSDTEFCLLLETPCTNLEILALFFDQLKSFKLPLEFAQTPLGLLVSEDDTPHRRLRLGFSSPAAVIAALDVLLNLHPGYEDVVLWSVVRHGHLDLAEHLIRHKHWSLELRWSGLTPLQTAVLYGHKYLVEFLLLQGADPKAVTLKRELTCLHLLMLVPRDHQTDLDIMESLLPYSIDINAAERCDELTALHIGVRNKKLHLVSVLLAHGANPDIPVRDQLELLAEGRSGLLKNSTSRPTQLVKDVTIIGEVLLQCNQDNVYPLDYVEKLLKLFLSTDTDKGFLPTSQIYVDSEKTTSILHLMALITLPNSFRIFELALSRFGKELVDIPDLHRDTPLHYACSSRQANNVDALIKLGADPFCTSYTGLTPFETMIYSSLILGPSICGFRNESVDDPENESKEPRNRSGRRISPMQIFEFDKEYNERFRIRQGLKIPCIREVYSVFEANNLRTENPLKELAAAWSPLTGNGEELYLSVTPLKHVHSNTETETGGNSNALTGAVDISDDTQCLPGLDPAQALSNSTIRKVALDQHQHFKMHLTDSPDFMICDHENYDWKDLERDSHDFYGKGKQILIPKKLTGGRPIFEIYGSIDWCGISE